MKSLAANVVLMRPLPWVLLGLLVFTLMGAHGSWAAEDNAKDGSERPSDCELTGSKREMLASVNEARSQARQCGDKRAPAVQPLTWSCTLEAAAKMHSQDMAEHDYFSHTDPSGDGIQQRVNNVGYQWRAVGENIAAGQSTVAAVVEGWLKSPGHCRNIMNEAFTEMGMAKAIPDGSSSTYTSYWNQTLAQPR